MKTINTSNLRSLFLDFFKQNDHAIIPGASIVPKEDPTALFITAGMQPLVPFLMGRPHPQGKRLADVQFCIRTTDIDEVGDNTHLTGFEMLGNWSLGDYFKDEAIAMTWQFLTDEQWLGIDPQKLAITCFAGDETVPRDEETAGIWTSRGVSSDRIYFYGREDNWWGPAGQTGPCGPDTEIFYWTGEGEPKDEPATNESWVEIWNNVFMQFAKQEDGLFMPLTQTNVDTGMGLERTAAILAGKQSVFETDAFEILMLMVPAGDERSRRIIIDHVRTSVFMAAAGVVPSNTDRGYVMRRLIRRAIRHARTLPENRPELISEMAAAVVDMYSPIYPELLSVRNDGDYTVIREEERRFGRTIEQGLREFAKATQPLKTGEVLAGQPIFQLYDTYGFPPEMTQELADEKGIILDMAGFEQALLAHQEKSRTATAGTFKSGLSDHGEMTVRYHTATHLLNEALREVLGAHVSQRGSNITGERLRFDFSHSEKMTDEQKQAVADIVNKQIAADLPVSFVELPLAEAQATGAAGVFGERYPDSVTVYSIGDFSKEICTGPHVAHTGELGHFKIIKEESAGSGIRRIKAVLE